MTARALAAVLSVAASFPAAAAQDAAPSPCQRGPWPHWQRYVDAFVAADGRVIDRSAHDRSTSEGQAYALFFSLVAGDRALFERVLRWTNDNLAQGDLARHLPAWHWGRDGAGRWRVLDENSASDADLWMAYALLEAGRLWSEPRFVALSRAILGRVTASEVADLPSLGPTLLPAPRGFEIRRGRAWRLNPSYLPPQLLRRLDTGGAPGAWGAVRASAVRIVRETSGRGVVPDWVLFRRGAGFAPDPVKGPVGSYDAIRAYLWIGMLPRDDPQRRALAEATRGLLRMFAERGDLPEAVDARTLRGRGRAPVGFYAALLPSALADGDGAPADALRRRVDAALVGGLYGSPPAYYDQNLILFAYGFTEGRYRFAEDGRLVPSWEGACEARAR